MTREVDPLIERIDQVLAENDVPAKACGGVVSETPLLVDEPGPPALVLPVDRASSAVEYVGFDVEEVEPRPGWLAQTLRRLFG